MLSLIYRADCKKKEPLSLHSSSIAFASDGEVVFHARQEAIAIAVVGNVQRRGEADEEEHDAEPDESRQPADAVHFEKRGEE